MASRKGLVKYGAYVRVIPTRNNPHLCVIEHEISFMLPPEAEAEDTDAVFATALARASKRWKNCWVVETWRY